MNPRALLISENVPVPADRRVWNEARTLAAAGWDVTVACPRGETRCTEPYVRLEGVDIHRYPLRPSAGGLPGYAREYAQATYRLWRLVRRLARERPFDVVHAANPPDFLLLAARGQRRRGARLVFDHHDLVPELYESRFGRGRGLPYRVALALERVAYAHADVAIVTNESYRRVAITRGHMDPSRVHIVRNGPDLERFTPVEPDPSLRGGRAHVIGYLGVMGPQDGIDHVLKALAELKKTRDDWRAVLIGDGDVLDEMRALAASLGIAEDVDFAGWRGDDDIRRMLCTADVCLAPDPPSPLNDVSTMIKVPEYLALGRPVVSYDLAETRVSAGDAALYARAGEPADLARCVAELLDDPARREAMGRAGQARAHDELSWERSSRSLLAAYEQALGLQRDGASSRGTAPGRLAGESSAG